MSGASTQTSTYRDDARSNHAQEPLISSEVGLCLDTLVICEHVVGNEIPYGGAMSGRDVGDLSREEWRNSVADLMILGSPSTNEIVIVWECLKPGGFAHGKAATVFGTRPLQSVQKSARGGGFCPSPTRLSSAPALIKSATR